MREFAEIFENVDIYPVKIIFIQALKTSSVIFLPPSTRCQCRLGSPLQMVDTKITENATTRTL